MPPRTRGAIEALRQLIATAEPGLVEGLKWNGPNYALATGEDRITLGVQRNGDARLVLHRGAKPSEDGAFSFHDRSGLADWPSSDRGLIIVKDSAEVERQAHALAELVQQWIAATSE